MALIKKIIAAPKTAKGMHDPVECTYDVLQIGKGKILQLDTYGRKTRKYPHKVSQSIQLDRESAMQLRKLIDETFSSD